MTEKPDFGKAVPDGSYAFDEFGKIDSVVSSTECTGLMYRPPADEDEAESYNEIYVVPKVANEEEKRLRADGKADGSK